MALAAKMPWYHSTGNRDEGFESSSSASLLHSIYGSQASQLLFSSSSGYIGSESSLGTTAERGSHAAPAPPPPPTAAAPPSSKTLQRARLQQRRARPKSSPVSTLVSRSQRQSDGIRVELTVRKTSLERCDSETAVFDDDPDMISASAVSELPGSPPPSPPEPRGGVAVTGGGRSKRSLARRPASAAVAAASQRRPPSASQFGSRRAAATLHRTRPKTAIGMRQQRKPSAVLMDLEEEEAEEQDPAIIRATPPVKLTRQPEYFNFWLGKPLQERDFGVQVHKRKAWTRPKSDYGNRLGGRGRGDGRGEKGDSGGKGELETVIEQDDLAGMSDASRLRGSKREGEGEEEGGGKNGKQTEGEDPGSGGGGGDNGKEGDGSELVGSKRDKDSKHKKKTKKSSKKSKSGKKSDKKVSLKSLSSTSEADADDYFNKESLKSVSWLDSSGSSKSTRFELPVDLTTLSDMSPLQYLRKHCIISNRRMVHCSEVFAKCDKDRDLRLNLEELKMGLIKAHHSCVTADQATSVLELARVPQDFKSDLKLFAALTCLTERIFDLEFLPFAGKEVVETVDFEALDWKLEGCNINTALYTVLTRL